MKDKSLHLLLLCTAMAINFLSSAVAEEPETISDSALQQIRALLQEKSGRTKVQRKLDSQFIYKLKQARGQEIAPGLSHLKPGVEVGADNRVLVDISATVSSNLLGQIERAGGTIINSYSDRHAIRAWLPLDQLEGVAALDDVTFVRRASRAMANVGAATSEGDVTHRANTVRSTFGASGQGVKVGVLSDGIDFLSEAQKTGDLSDVTVLPGQTGNGSEGTGMLEIIHDLAPDAELCFATAINGPASFAQNILNLRSNGCDIIVEDVYYYDEPVFQDGPIAQAVNAVTADGALFFSAAGNDGNQKYNTSGTWEGDFADGGQAIPPFNLGGGRIHSFGSTNYNIVLADCPGVDLFWADPLGASTNDYDLFLLDWTGSNVVASSTNPQNGTQDPHESVVYPGAGQRIVIVKSSGSSRYLHLVATRGRLSFHTAGATRGHGTATNAFSIAAVNALNAYPAPFDSGLTNTVETYSSDGPRRMFFQQDGTPITPDNFSASGGALRQKPDFTAADGTATHIVGQFFGTSAAAPHAAAIAALLRSYDPSLNAAQIRNAFAASAIDIESPGVDINSGAGIIMALKAIQSLPPKPLIRSNGAILVNESTPNGAIDPGETVTLALSLKNIGTTATGNLVAALVVSNGVTFPSAAQSYGVIVPRGATNRLFTYIAAGNCGDSHLPVLELRDGNQGLGLVTYSLQLGTQRIPILENFDSLSPPAIPSGWSRNSSGSGPNWVTTTNQVFDPVNYQWSSPISPPNCAYVQESATTSDKSLVTPGFPVVSTNALLSFYQHLNSPYGYSGGVLEISINGGIFQDILAAGGYFVRNGYNGYISSGSGNPLGDNRVAWVFYVGGAYYSGDAFIPTIVQLPATAAGNNIRLRWRYGTCAYSNGYGWWIDSIKLTDGYDCGTPLPDNLVVSINGSSNPVLVGGPISYTINIGNTGPGTATAVNAQVVLSTNFTFQTISLSDGLYPGPGVNGGGTLNFSLSSLAAGETATITMGGTADKVGVLTNRVTVSRAEPDANTNDNSALELTTVTVPTITTINDVTLSEGNSGTTNAVFHVALSPAPFQSASVNFATANLSAFAGTDYYSTNGKLDFGPGVTNQSFAVRVIGNALNEPDKSFKVNLSAPANASLAQSSATGTILNDDPLPNLFVSDATVVKPYSGTTNLSFQVFLDHPSGRTVSLSGGTADDSAQSYVDYQPMITNVVFNKGQTNATILVTVTNHISQRPSQTLNFEIWSPDYAKLAHPIGVGTILTALPGQMDHFIWDVVSSPQSNGIPFNAKLTAWDYFGDIATNFVGTAHLSSSWMGGSFRTNTLFSNTNNLGTRLPGYTYGYRFTPKTNIIVTHFRHASGTKATIWDETGQVVASRSVVNSTPGQWSETPLVAPVELRAGKDYVLGFYTGSQDGYYGDYPASDNSDVSLGQSLSSAGDTLPLNPDDFPYYQLIDMRFLVSLPIPLPVQPAITGNFTNGYWSGPVNVRVPATNVTLFATDNSGHDGTSQSFDVLPTPGQVTRYVWSAIPSPQPISNLFTATLTARDYFDQTVSNFTGTVQISGTRSGLRTNNILGNPPKPLFNDVGSFTRGYAFTLTTNITVTHVRHYYGTKVSIWTDSGTLLASRAVSSTPGKWKETALTTPLNLLAGQTYRIGVYTANSTFYYNAYYGSTDEPTNCFADGTFDQAYYTDGDGFPAYYDYAWELVDLRYTAPVVESLPVAPTKTTGFVGGVWAGSLLINQIATNAILFADDGEGLGGTSNPFNVAYLPGYLERFAWNQISSPQTNGSPFNVTITGLDHFNAVATNFKASASLTVQGGLPPAPEVGPVTTGNFSQGVWNGALQLSSAASNVILRVDDGLNHSGLSNPFDVATFTPPLLSSIFLESSNIKLNWGSVSGRLYQVQYTTNLLSPIWLDLGGPITATNTGTWISYPVNSDPQRFYRIMLLP